MAATFCTEAELRANLSLGSLYSSATVEEVCQAGQNIITDYLWKNQAFNSAHSHIVGAGSLYFDTPHDFFVGQVVTVSGNGSTFNGSKTITAVDTYSITFATSHSTVEPIHPTSPYGTVAATDYVTYSTVPEVKLATLMVCTEIWQAKQAANGGALDPNFQPSPFKMGSTLLAKVRGLLANHLAPNGLIG
jgi:hypothetical protein